MRMPLNDKKIQPNHRNASQNEENVHTKCKCSQIYFPRGNIYSLSKQNIDLDVIL